MFSKPQLTFNPPLITCNVLLSLVIVIFPSILLAAGMQNISCEQAGGGKKQIYVEYLNANHSACRTIYNAGGNQSKVIAWAQSNSQVCTDVANKVMSKLGRSGWNCNANNDTPIKKPALRIARLKKHKKSSQTSYIDYALLNSIKK